MFSNLMRWVFNLSAAATRNKPDQVIAALRLRPGDVVVDIGSGGGFYTLAFARQLCQAEVTAGGGKVYAVDVRADFLHQIRREARRQDLYNVETVLLRDDGPEDAAHLELPLAGVDLFFLRDVFHHLPEPVQYLRHLKLYLKPAGRVAIIDYMPPGRFGLVRLFGHYSSVDAIRGDLGEAGYRLTESFDFLPAQSYNIFTAS
jgi:arsenite methyltransferase